MLYDKLIIGKKKLRNRCILLQLIGGLTMCSTVPFVLMIHISIAVYQHIYFSIFEIPKVRIADYFIIDRHKLKKINMMQKIACAYCGYCNGLAAWLQAVANRTELYSCAIKHKTPAPGQEHQKNFYAYQDFE